MPVLAMVLAKGTFVHALKASLLKLAGCKLTKMSALVKGSAPMALAFATLASGVSDAHIIYLRDHFLLRCSTRSHLSHHVCDRANMQIYRVLSRV